MSVLDLLKKKINHISILLTREELKSVLAASVLEPPHGARYKIGDIIRNSAIGSAPGTFKVYGIKAGGYGFAYIVLDKETLTPYCLKTSRNNLFDEPRTIEQFKREAETWIRLGKHPNLVYAHSVLNIRGRPHILLEYMAGSDLWSKIKSGPLPVRTTLKYAIQFCRGMVHAREKVPGFVHGDIKPNNCLLTQDDTLKIGDFGQADVWAVDQELAQDAGSNGNSNSATEIFHTPKSKWRAGTPPYMAPEQFDSTNKTDARSDVYSFGVMLFEMLTATRPFKGKKHRECFAQHSRGIPPDPISINTEIPPPLARLILGCLAKSPAERPGDFAVLENELSDLLWSICQEKLPPVTPEELTDVELLNRGVSLSALGRYDEALTCFDNFLSSKPLFARAWSYRADALSGLGRYDEALACFDRALTLEPPSAMAWSNKGKALDQLKRYDEALACFDRAMALESRLASVWNDKGRTFIDAGQFEEALACLNRALAIDAQHFEAQNNRGIAYSKLGRDQEAIEAYKQAISINPEHAEAHYNRGNTYSHLGHMKEAIESYVQAISLKPDYREARDNLRNEYRRFYRTSKQFVSESYAETMIAFLLDDQNSPKAVVTSGIDFFQSSNFDPKVFYLCGNKIYPAVEKIRRKQKATLADSLAKVRENIYTLEGDRSVFYWLGKIYYGLNRYDECLEVFQESITLFGADDKALYYLAACNEIQGSHQLALDYYKRALLFDPNCSLTLDGIKRMEAELA
jgi:serine/threonine protein kinase